MRKRKAGSIRSWIVLTCRYWYLTPHEHYKGASALALQSGLNPDWIESGLNPDSIQSGLDRVRTILSCTTETDRVFNALCGY